MTQKWKNKIGKNNDGGYVIVNNLKYDLLISEFL